MNPVRVLSVASEIYPVIKTGGLADVVGALPTALRAEGIETRTLVPGYPAVTNALKAAEEVLDLPNFHGGSARVLAGSCAGIDLFVLDAAHLLRVREIPIRRLMAPTGPTTRSVSQASDALRPTSAEDQSRHSCPTSCTPMTGRPD